MAQFSEHTKQRLAEVVLPPVGTIKGNPVGLSPVSAFIPGVYRNTYETVLQDENIDMFLVALCTVELEDDSTLAMLGELLPQMAARKPVVVATTAPEDINLPRYQWLAEKGLPVYRDPKVAAIALAKLAEYGDFVRSCAVP